MNDQKSSKTGLLVANVQLFFCSVFTVTRYAVWLRDVKAKCKETSVVTLIFPARHLCPLHFASIPRSKRACGVLVSGEAFVPPDLFLMVIFGLNFYHLEFQLGTRSSSFCCRLLSSLFSDSSTVSFAFSTLTGEKQLWQPRYEAAWR